MRIAIHNLYFGEFVAEAELSRRICTAAATLGWEAIEVGSSTQINQIKPDFVLSLHFRTPKLTEYPTYGCMWNPPSVIESDPSFIKNVLTYDGYLSASSQVDSWLHHLLYGRAKKSFTTPFYTSCNRTPYQAPNLKDPHLVYFGTNWDGPRFKQLFERLDPQEFMQVYGKETAWEYLKSSYRGALPFDGTSVLDTLNQAGIGLCLHTPQHCAAGVPSMRIFEIVASGAIALCEPHPFINTNFGDSVLYIDPVLPPDEKACQIAQAVDWVRQNPQPALAMSQKAHHIFFEQFALENLLLGIVPHHEALIQQKGFIETAPELAQSISPPVEFIVRVEDNNLKFLQRALLSLARQTYPSIAVLIILCRPIEGLQELLEQYQTRLKIKTINSSPSEFRSTPLWSGLHAITADYFAILNEHDLIYPNHVHTLMRMLQGSQTARVAYSGGIYVTDSQDSQPAEPAEIGCFEPFNLDKMLRFENLIASNSFIAKTELIDDEIQLDPKLSIAEDLFLLLHFCRKTQFGFSYEVTCEYSRQQPQSSNAALLHHTEAAWIKPLQRLLADQVFPVYHNFPFAPCSTKIQPDLPDPDSTELETVRSQLRDANLQLHRANVQVAAIQSSKFWKIRRFWFRLKRIIGLSRADQLVP